METGCTIAEIRPIELKQRLAAGENPVILDVREPHELEICRLENTAHIPLGALKERISELEQFKGREIVVYCRSGGRSQRAASFLASNGFKPVYNLVGGILAWADEIDPSLARY
jgi:adenylyltransferase/sulfurtransferase